MFKPKNIAIKCTNHSLKRYLTIALFFVITINTQISYTLMFVILVLLVIDKNTIENLVLLLDKKFFISFFGIFLLHLLGLLWTESYVEGLRILSKQKIYLFAPMLLIFVDRKTAQYSILALISAVLATEGFSIYLYFFSKNLKNASDLSPFMNHMHFSLILAFTVGYLINKINFDKLISTSNALLASLAALTLITLFINIGRVGQLALPFVMIILAIDKFKLSFTKSVVAVSILASILFVTTYNFNSQFQTRLDRTVYEFQNNVGKGNRSSISCRFEMWDYAITLGSKNPVFGIGTGDSIQEMKLLLGEDGLTNLYKDCNLGINYQLNPHNNYFLYYMQFGFIGGLVLAMVAAIQISTAISIKSTPMKLLLAVTFIGMLTTSPISMHVKYMFFYSLLLTMLYIEKTSHDHQQ